MEVWQEFAKNAENGAERFVAEYGDRLYAALVFSPLAYPTGVWYNMRLTSQRRIDG